MYWLDNNTGISTAPTPPAVISSTKRFFTNGGLGEQPSIPEDFWFNMIQEELLGVLTLAGITPDKSDLNQVAKAIQSLAFNSYPVGAPIPWPQAVPPTGFIVMTGQSFSATAYPQLALAYPSLVLPDMRADFIRGWDNGRGVDSGRSLLSHQGDAIRNITASVSSLYSPSKAATGAFTISSFGNSPAKIGVIGGDPGDNAAINFNASSVVPTAAENRPSNTAFNYIVRAA